MDSNVKLNRYRYAGPSQLGMEPVFSTYLGAAHKRVWQLTASGSLAGSAGSSGGDNGDDGDLDAAAGAVCHPNLSCARVTSTLSGISDECGLTGGVCSHGIPLEGMLLAMPAPERFVYYDELLKDVLAELQVDQVFIDVGCVFGPHWQKLTPPEDPSPRFIKVPWWHAQGHGPDCYLANSGLYHPGMF
jgi:hypothetical protein